VALSEDKKQILRELGRVQSGRGFEERSFWLGLGLTIALTVTGLWLFFVDRMDHVDMSLLLFHIVGGFPFLIPCVMLAKRHRRYVEIIRSKRFATGGWITTVVMALTFVSGVWLTFRGVTGIYWLWLLHVVVSLAAVFGLGWYIRSILGTFQVHLPQTQRASGFFRDMLGMLSKRVSAIAVMALCLTVLGAMAYTEPDRMIEVPDYVEVVEGDPFFPSRAEGEGFYNPEHFLRSQSCGVGGCHEATTEQWMQSVHYLTPTPVFAAVEALFKEEARKGEFLASRDPLQVETDRSVHGGEESFRFCAGCHTPVALFAGEIGLGEGLPTFEEREGSSCIFCHRIEATGEKSNGGGGDYRISAPPERYLFAFSDHPVGVWLNKTLINSKPEHHKQMFMKPFYEESEYCIGCHRRLQYSYWKDSVYADPDHSEHKECQDCHFAEVEVEHDVSAYTDGVVADHRSLGANLVTAMIYGHQEQYDLTLAFMQDDNQKLLVLAPSHVEPGGTLDLGVHVINKGAGHTFPAGPESDLLEAWTEVIITDAGGAQVYAYGLLDPETGYLDHEQTYVYNVRPIDRNGNMLELDRHRNWLFTEDRMHVLPPKGYDQHHFEVKLPPDLTGPLTVSVRLRFRKFNQEFLDFAAAGGFMERLEAPVVELDVVELGVVLTGDEALLAAAGTEFDALMDEPPELGVYTRKANFDDYTLTSKLSLADQYALKQAKALFEAEDFGEALAVLTGIADANKDKKRIREFRRLLENSVAENVDFSGEKPDPFHDRD